MSKTKLARLNWSTYDAIRKYADTEGLTMSDAVDKLVKEKTSAENPSNDYWVNRPSEEGKDENPGSSQEGKDFLGNFNVFDVGKQTFRLTMENQELRKGFEALSIVVDEIKERIGSLKTNDSVSDLEAIFKEHEDNPPIEKKMEEEVETIELNGEDVQLNSKIIKKIVLKKTSSGEPFFRVDFQLTDGDFELEQDFYQEEDPETFKDIEKFQEHSK